MPYSNLEPITANENVHRNIAQYNEYDAVHTPTKLTLRHPNGEKETFTSYEDRMANDFISPEAELWRQRNPYEAHRRRYKGPNNPENSLAHTAGSYIRDLTTGKDSILNKILDGGPIPSALAGATLGFGADSILKLITGKSLGSKAWIAPLLGGLLGSGWGFLKRSINAKEADKKLKQKQELEDSKYEAMWRPYEKKAMVKYAAMYRDPRNFILEKLQSAKDVTLAEKAALSIFIRQMDTETAAATAKAVRAAVGIGVGKLLMDIYKFNTAFNGMGDAMAPYLMKAI